MQFAKFLATFSLVIVCGCTVTPVIVKPSSPSFDGANQNSGVIGLDSAGNAIITPSKRDRYNGLILSGYGTNFIPHLILDAGITPTTTNTFLIDPEHLVKFGVMEWHRRQQ